MQIAFNGQFSRNVNSCFLGKISPVCNAAELAWRVVKVKSAFDAYRESTDYD